MKLICFWDGVIKCTGGPVDDYLDENLVWTKAWTSKRDRVTCSGCLSKLEAVSR